jgi:ABC-type amino acid transport substrate-binding protein
MIKSPKYFLIILCLFLSSLYQSACAESVRIGYFQHPPHQYVNKDGKPEGATITYFEQIATKMGYEVNWVGPLPLIRLLVYIKEGTQLDGTAHLVKNPEFVNYMYYGDKPYHFARSILVVKKENKLNKIKSIDNIKGYNVLYLKGHSPSKFIQENILNLKISLIIPHKSMWQKSLRMLTIGRVDAVYDLNEFSLPFVAKTMNISDKIKTLLLPEPLQAVYVAFSKNSPRGKLLIEKYNKAHDKFKFDHDDYEKLIREKSHLLSIKGVGIDTLSITVKLVNSDI